MNAKRGSTATTTAKLLTVRAIVGLFFIAATMLGLSACAPQNPTVIKIKLATVPVGDSVGRLDEPVHDKQALRFMWTFQTHLEGAPYIEWVSAGLQREGFAIQQRQDHLLTMAKLEDGDAYRLRVEVTAERPTRVEVRVTVSPD